MPDSAAPTPFNPYAALRRLQWARWWQQSRQQPAQTALHGLVIASLALLALPLLMQALAGARPQLQYGWDHYPGIAVGALFAMTFLHDLVALLRWQQRLHQHWLWSQPIAPRVLQREAWRLLALRVVWQTAALIGLSQACQRISLLAALPLLLIAALLAHLAAPWFGHHRRRQQRQAAARQTPFRFHGQGSLLRWQWQQLGSCLSPKRLAPLWLVWLAIPMGPASLALIAAYLMLLLSLLQAWTISLNLIPQAHAWLRWQPVAPRRWLIQACGLPLALLGAACLTLAIPTWLGGKAVMLWWLLPSVVALAALHLCCALAYRPQPRRIERQFGVHALLLVACIQALPPALPLIWLLQITVLLRRAIRTP